MWRGTGVAVGADLLVGESGLVSSTATVGAAADKRVPVVVFFNGNLMTIERADDLYRRLAGLGVEVVAYDYRGYGFSTGMPDVGAFPERWAG